MVKAKSYELSKDVPSQNKKRICRFLEVIILSLVVLLVCGNFALPTIFYYTRPTETGNDNSSSVDVCLEHVVYSGVTCRAELQVYQECFSGSAGSNGDILIRSDINQETVETDAELLINGALSFLNPSAECLAAIRPFLCLYLFGVCDSSSQLRQVSSSECVDLRDDICATEWSAAVGFLGPGKLPVCEELSVQMADKSCSVNSTSTFSEENFTSRADSTPQCEEDYYLSNESLCLPVCGNYTLDDLSDVFTVLSSCIAIVCGILVIVISFTIQRELMLKFPSCFMLYLCLSAVFEGFIVLVGFFDKEALFCNNIDLLDSIANPTPFCSISGIAFYYTLMQSTLWVLFYVTALFWGIAFPFHYRKIKANGYIKYIHITAVAVAVLVPLVSSLAPLKDGFILPTSTPIVCIAANADYTFYTLVLPISILLAISTCLLIFTFWIILKEFVIKKISRGKKASRVGKAQVKIMFVLVYYILLGGLVLGVFSYYVGINEKVFADQQKYYACESFGANTGKDCSALRSTSIDVFSDLGIVSIVLQGLVSFVILIFIAECKCCKKRRRKTASSSKYSAATNSIHLNSNSSGVSDEV